MAYNRENKLKQIIDVQRIYQKHKVEGVTTVYVYNTFIKPVYHITIQTLYTYLQTRAEHELKQLQQQKEEKKNQQLNLFNN